MQNRYEFPPLRTGGDVRPALGPAAPKAPPTEVQGSRLGMPYRNSNCSLKGCYVFSIFPAPPFSCRGGAGFQLPLATGNSLHMALQEPGHGNVKLDSLRLFGQPVDTPIIDDHLAFLARCLKGALH